MHSRSMKTKKTTSVASSASQKSEQPTALLTTDTRNKNTNASMDKKMTKKSFSGVDKRITRKAIREFDISRISDILKILPQFSKFYDKLTEDEIMAVKYYKGFGSFFQSKLLAAYNAKSGEPRRISFPFSMMQERFLIQDILGMKNTNLLGLPANFDIKELPEYIKKSYSVRIELLNRLDSIYNRVDCPKMKGTEILFRGMGGLSKDISNLKVGDTYTFKNFISTTLDKAIAEDFSGAWANENDSCIFILMDMKDIPFLYMPNAKLRDNTSYSKFMLGLQAAWDYSEFTLPRNLEFRIERIEHKPLASKMNYKISYDAISKTINKTLKNKGYFNSTLPEENKDEEQENQNTNTHNIIEQNLFAHIPHYYCSLKEWKPRQPIKWEEISAGAKYILDKTAANSWQPTPRMDGDGVFT